MKMTWWGWMLAGIGAFMLLVMIIALPTILVGLFRHEKKYRKKNKKPQDDCLAE